MFHCTTVDSLDTYGLRYEEAMEDTSTKDTQILMRRVSVWSIAPFSNERCESVRMAIFRYNYIEKILEM